MPDTPNSLEARLRYAREELLSRYPECTCHTDASPLCECCLVRESLNEVGNILDDLKAHFLGRESR